jgi:hypothetical protein
MALRGDMEIIRHDLVFLPSVANLALMVLLLGLYSIDLAAGPRGEVCSHWRSEHERAVLQARPRYNAVATSCSRIRKVLGAMGLTFFVPVSSAQLQLRLSILYRLGNCVVDSALFQVCAFLRKTGLGISAGSYWQYCSLSQCLAGAHRCRRRSRIGDGCFDRYGTRLPTSIV